MAVDRFGTLFSKSWDSFGSLWRPLLAGALAASLMTSPLQHAIQANVLEGQDPNTMIVMMALFMIVSLVVGMLAYFYMMLVAVKKEVSPGKALAGLGPVAWPLTLVSFWVIVRSYTWIMFVALGLFLLSPFVDPAAQAVLSIVGVFLFLISFIFAIVRGPRYVPAPFMYLKEKGKLEPKAAVDASYARTEGYWGKIIGGALLMGLVALLVGIVVGIPVALFLNDGVNIEAMQAGVTPAPTFLTLVGAFITATASMLIQGFTMIFWSNMTDTIIANPRKAA